MFEKFQNLQSLITTKEELQNTIKSFKLTHRFDANFEEESVNFHLTEKQQQLKDLSNKIVVARADALVEAGFAKLYNSIIDECNSMPGHVRLEAPELKYVNSKPELILEFVKTIGLDEGEDWDDLDNPHVIHADRYEEDATYDFESCVQDVIGDDPSFNFETVESGNDSEDITVNVDYARPTWDDPGYCNAEFSDDLTVWAKIKITKR